MKTKHLLFITLAIAVLSLSSCSSDCDEPNCDTPSESTFVEAPKCDGTVTVAVYNPDLSRYSTSFLEENKDNLTATRVDTKNSYVLVSYHGRYHADPTTANIGMVQLVKYQSGVQKVLSELFLKDARVNFAQFYNTSTNDGVVYIGVDRNSGKEPFCGIIAVPVKNQKFDLEGADEATFTPYKVEGVSINCIKQHNGDTKNFLGCMVVASGGNEALGDNGLAGFTKFGISREDPTKLAVIGTDLGTNYRGYWFSYGYINGAPSCYTYRTVEDGALVYKLGAVCFDTAKEMFAVEGESGFNFDFINSVKPHGAEVEVWRENGTTSSYGRYNCIAIKKNGVNFIIVATGKKEGGIVAYRFDHDHKNRTATLTKVDEWHKFCNCLSTEVIAGNEYYIFVAGSDGVYKVRLDFDASKPNSLTMVPVAKRVTTVTTESETLASSNYLQVSGSGSNALIHVAGGYEGYYKLQFNDAAFRPCDPRTVFYTPEK